LRRAVRIAFVLLTCTSACAQQPAALRGVPDGVYRGHATYRGARLEFSVHFRSDGNSLRASFNSPDLLILDQSLDQVTFTPPRIAFTTADDHPVRFEGVVAGDSIAGGATVGAVPGVVAAGDSARMRFVLRRTTEPPPPYVAHDVRFRSGDVQLAGTVYLPPGRPHTLPGVVILQGSTANGRRDYRFFADYFARAGFAVLVFDKRGHGGSGGAYLAATYEDLARDATAALARLRAEPQVEPSRVGLWGLSQGAFIAPMVAAHAESLAFVVAVSAPGLPIGLCSAYQDSVRLRAAGFGVAEAQHAAALDRRILEWLRTGNKRESLEDELRGLEGSSWRRASSIPSRLPQAPALESWYWRGRTLDPLPAWRALQAPALVVFGAADELLPAAPSAANIGRALEDGGNRDHTLRTFPAANHVLRTLPLVAGGAWDWPRAAPGYLDLVTDWMRAHARPKP
jgi:pimeloyl-ACP methyl ester carboxylesterase